MTPVSLAGLPSLYNTLIEKWFICFRNVSFSWLHGLEVLISAGQSQLPNAISLAILSFLLKGSESSKGTVEKLTLNMIQAPLFLNLFLVRYLEHFRRINIYLR
jgi:hypothetical protein